MTLTFTNSTSLSMFRVLLIQVFVLTVASAFPYVVVPASAAGSSDLALEKRAFDRLEEGHGFGLLKRSLVKRAFDRVDEADFGFRKKRAFDRIARTDFGFRRKRSFDRLGGTEFGLMKRSVPVDRDELIDDLSASILALRHAREADPLVLLSTPENDE